MSWNIAAESMSLVILGIIMVYSRRGSNLPSLKNKVFHGCLLITFSAILTNILSTIMIYNFRAIPLSMTWVVTTIYFILTPLMGLAYYLYTVSLVCTESCQLRRAIAVGVVPGAAYLVMVLMNPINKQLFDLNMEEGYIRGHMIVLTYLVFYAYCLACIVVTVINHKRVQREIYKILAAFPILAVLVIIFQQFYPNVILSGSAATCALLIIYLHLQNRQISLDYLTNVPNRHELLDMLGYMLKKSPDKEFALMVVSLRDFRQINNACGQQNGDGLLREVSRFLCGIVPHGTVYRYSGDEFAILFTPADKEQVGHCIEAIQDRMKQPWQVADYRIMADVVVGIINHSEAGESLERIVGAIEYAVSQAKTGRNGSVCYCDEAMLGKLERKRQVIQILKDQIARESFEMYYQPIYSVESGCFRDAESLMRIPDSPIGPIYPSEFIPIAEETGLLIDITYIILDKVCRYINRLLAQGIDIRSIHVNFSAVQFSQRDLKDKVLEIIRRNNTPMSAIKIEFTESTLAESTEVVTDFAMEMKRHGIMMGLDDFGTGYSNISTVIRIPFGTVKLDKSLVWVSIDNENSALAVKNLTYTFKQLGMMVVAEGVENEEQKALVNYFGVDQIQGFYYARPLPGDEMEQFMLQHSISGKSMLK